MIRVSYDHGEIDEADVDPPAAKRLGEIQVSTLVVIGERDRVDIRRAATQLVAGIKGAELNTIPSAAHLPSLERPDRSTRSWPPFWPGSLDERHQGHAIGRLTTIAQNG